MNAGKKIIALGGFEFTNGGFGFTNGENFSKPKMSFLRAII